MDNLSLQHLKLIKGSSLFNASWYRKTYPDVVLVGMDPAEHYLRIGAALGRDPSPEFSTRYYAVSRPDVKRSGLNPLVHYLTQKNSANPDPRLVLQAAYAIGERGNYDLAIALAKRDLPDELTHSIEILRANAAIVQGREKAWLAHLNAYLDNHGVAPVRLSEGTGTWLKRLYTDPLPAVTGGPLVSVIMPAWNAEETVGAAARSILNQTWRNLELLIVDDASQDSTWSILQHLADSDSRVAILQNSVNAGPYASKNVALMSARGEYVTGHDSDDWAHPQRVERQVSFLRRNGLDFGLIGMLRMAGDGRITRINRISRNTPDGASAPAFISLMIETACLRERYGFWDDVRFGGDSELIRRIEAVEGVQLSRDAAVGLFAYDNPQGLTNDPELGYQPRRPSVVRTRNLDHLAHWHKQIDASTAYVPFPHSPRLFPAEPQSLNSPETLKTLASGHGIDTPNSLEDGIRCDVCVVTDLRFPGGNASSTAEEIRQFEAAGYKVALIHCPRSSAEGSVDTGSPEFARRYEPYKKSIHQWNEQAWYRCRHLIVRHPRVIVSKAFQQIAYRIHSEIVHLVINNSRYATNGGSDVYEIPSLREAMHQLTGTRLEVCPISPLIRSELEEALPPAYLSTRDWTPTVDTDYLSMAPKPRLLPPFRIGRHGRDGPEKWLETAPDLRRAYPDNPDFRIHILGGAKHAEAILGGLPPNWAVWEFDAIRPREYLQELDAFVYYPNTTCREAFGRTIIEAMIAGVPCILPNQFHQNFGDLAFYCEPDEVPHVVWAMADKWSLCRQLLKHIQRIAISIFSSSAVANRFPDLERLPRVEDRIWREKTPSKWLRLDNKSLALKRKVLSD